MKQERAKTLNLVRGSAVKGRKRGAPRMMKVTFGSVTVATAVPAHDEVERNIEAGQAAMARGLRALLKPGVRILSKKNVPLFSVDPDNPRIIIRKLNGKTDRGTLNRKTGTFEVCP